MALSKRPYLPRVFAIIPAAGWSRRMGTAKQLMDVGGRPMLRAVIDALAASKVHSVQVVTRREIAEKLGLVGARIVPLPSDSPGLRRDSLAVPPEGAPLPSDSPGLRQDSLAVPPRDLAVSPTGPEPWSAKVFVSFNEDESKEMIDSIRIGMRGCRERMAIGDGDGFLICPGDHPGISVADLDSCIAAFGAAPDRIVVAARDGRRGHPVIFPESDAAFVESTACDSGLHHLSRNFPDRVYEVACESVGILRDLDTPNDVSG